MAEVKPLLSNAIAAVRTVCVGFNEEGEDVYVGPNTAEEIATAVLNATAAPDLFEAANAALGALTGNMDGDWLGQDPVALLRAALSKATTQQEGR
nr:hypothetical protein [Brevundimonas naejangsanensis]